MSLLVSSQRSSSFSLRHHQPSSPQQSNQTINLLVNQPIQRALSETIDPSCLRHAVCGKRTFSHYSKSSHSPGSVKRDIIPDIDIDRVVSQQPSLSTSVKRELIPDIDVDRIVIQQERARFLDLTEDFVEENEREFIDDIDVDSLLQQESEQLLAESNELVGDEAIAGETDEIGVPEIEEKCEEQPNQVIQELEEFIAEVIARCQDKVDLINSGDLDCMRPEHKRSVYSVNVVRERSSISLDSTSRCYTTSVQSQQQLDGSPDFDDLGSDDGHTQQYEGYAVEQEIELKESTTTKHLRWPCLTLAQIEDDSAEVALKDEKREFVSDNESSRFASHSPHSLSAKLEIITLSDSDEDEDIDVKPVKHESTRRGRTHIIDCTGQARQFVRVLAVASLCYNALILDQLITKRSIYYSDESLFPTQDSSDSAIKRLCDFLGRPRHELNVVATGKGLVCGALKYRIEGSSEWISSSLTQPTVIPVNAYRISEFQFDSDITHCLIVEKDTVFNHLLQCNYAATSKSIVITGKGQPCLATRQFLFRLYCHYPHLPFFVLVDADPYGLSIYSLYRYGSEQIDHMQSLAVNSARMLGLRMADVLGTKAQTKAQPLTESDKRKLHHIKNSSHALQLDWELQQECDDILQCGLKAEIEVLGSISPNFLADTYLARRIRRVSGLSISST